MTSLGVRVYVQHLDWWEKWRPEYLRDEWQVPEVLEKYGAFGFIGYDQEGSPGMDFLYHSASFNEHSVVPVCHLSLVRPEQNEGIK